MFQAFTRVGMTTGIDTGGLGAAWDIYRPIFDLWRQGAMGFRARLYVGATVRGSERQQIAEWIARFRDDVGDDQLWVVAASEIISFGYHDLEGLTPFHVPLECQQALAETTRMKGVTHLMAIETLFTGAPRYPAWV